MPNYGAGITERLQAQDLMRQRLAENAMVLDAQRRAQAARGPAGQILLDTYGAPPPQPPAIPPAPPMMQPPAPQPGAMSPGGGNPQTGPVMQPAAMQPPPIQPKVIPPFKPLPAPAAAGAGPTAPGQVPPPPAAAPAQPAVQQPKQLDLKTIIGGLKAQGVPPEKVMDMLDILSPVMSANNKAELEGAKRENAALKAATEAYKAYYATEAKQREVAVKEEEAKRRKDQGDARIAILKAKGEAAAAGKGNIRTQEFVYPKGEDGKADTSKGPIGSRIVTKSGKIIQLDVEGNPVTTLGGVTSKESKDTNVHVKDTVRSNIVKAGVNNALARLNEIDKLGDISTSMFFGQSGGNPATRALYGMGRSAQSGKQQEVDAKWSSMIDEAIPVFTGGLRGSDAFRRFLIEQAPAPGDKPETIREKKRLFRANINGTSHAFFDKFQNDPSMWAPGVTKDQVQAAGGGGGTPKGIPEGSKVIGKTPDGKDVYQAPDGKNYTAD